MRCRGHLHPTLRHISFQEATYPKGWPLLLLSLMMEVPDYALSRNDTSAPDSHQYVLLTVKETTSALDMTEGAVRKRLSRGKLPGLKIAKTRYVRLAVV